MSDLKVKYANSATVFGTNDLDSLASDTNLLAGRESGVIDNATNRYVDALLAGRFKANNTAPTAGRQIEVWVGAQLEDTPIYPDVFDGGSSAETVTSADIKSTVLRLAALIPTDANANRDYSFAPVSVASLFGGVLPKKWFVFVTHNMGQALNTTAGQGGQCWYNGITYESV